MNDEKYLIKNSTKEERRKRLEHAIAISTLDSSEPSKEAKEIYEKYIEGLMELPEVLEEVLKIYKD